MYDLAARMRIAASSSMQKLRGQAPKRTYPHTEGFLGELMVKGSTDLGEDSYFGWLLCSFTSPRVYHTLCSSSIR